MKTYLKSIIIIFSLIIFISEVFSNNFYFSSSTGNDSYTSAQAQNPATPWKTIDKLNASMSLINPGDSILFRRGDVFTGQIMLTRSGTSNARIVFSAFGAGNNPILKGTLPVTGWTKYNNNIWVADCPQLDSAVTNFFINDISQQIGRYPNSDAPNHGYLNIDAHIGKISISSNSLSSLTNWTRGKVIIRTQRFYLEEAIVKSHQNKVLDFETPTFFDIPDNFGFFIENHINTLDKEGEWFHDIVEKKIYLFLLSDPNLKKTEATAFTSNFEANDRHYFSILDIELKGSRKKNILICRSDYVEIRNNVLSSAGSDAVNIIECSNVSFTNNKVNNTNNNALIFVKCENIDVNNNEILNTGTRLGMVSRNFYYNYIGTFLEYSAIFLEGNKINCVANVIDSSGFIGVYFDGNDILIKNNFVNNFCFNLDDGGGIYSYNGQRLLHNNRRVESNIILNGKGAGFGTDNHLMSLANGIFLDYGTDHVFIVGNTIAYCNIFGIFNNYSNTNSILNNTLFNNSKQIGFTSGRHNIPSPIINYIVQSNIFFSKSDKEVLATFTAKTKREIEQFGTFEGNYYCRPVNDYETIQTVYLDSSVSPPVYTSEFKSLKTWQNEYNKDLGSKPCTYQLPMYSVISANEPNKILNSSFDNNISGWYCWSTYNNGNAIWDNNGILDNGCLKLNFSNLSGKPDAHLLGVVYIGEIVAGENYILKFTIVSTHPEKNIKVSLRQSAAPYNLAPEQYILANLDRQSYELLFTPSLSNSNAMVYFTISEDDKSYWIDNVEMIKANIRISNTEDSIKFIYNIKNSAISFNDDNYYLDVKGNQYHNFTIQPYNSLVLLKVPQQYFDSHPSPINVTSLSIISTNGHNYISIPNGSLQLTATVSPDNASDKSVIWTIQNVTGQAIIDDTGVVTALADGSVTVIAIANDGSGVTGSINIEILNQGTSIKPVLKNKPYSILVNESNLCIVNINKYQQIRLYNISGILMQNKMLTDNECIIDVSSFQPGIYIIELIDLSGKIETIKVLLP